MRHRGEARRNSGILIALSVRRSLLDCQFQPNLVIAMTVAPEACDPMLAVSWLNLIEEYQSESSKCWEILGRNNLFYGLSADEHCLRRPGKGEVNQ
jgi:hypothetical protein